MRLRTAFLAVLVVGAAIAASVRIAGCFEGGRAELDAEARRIADGVDTRAAKDVDELIRMVRGAADVYAARELADPRSSGERTWAELKLRIALTIPSTATLFEGPTGTFIGCYRFSATYYEVRTRKVTCPATIEVRTPAPPPPVDDIANGSDIAVSGALGILPPAVTTADAELAILARLPAPEVDSRNGRPHLPPRVSVLTRPNDSGGSDVGVAVFAVETRQCLLANRIDGAVLAWSAPPVTMQPGEGVCDAAAALNGLYARSPH